MERERHVKKYTEFIRLKNPEPEQVWGIINRQRSDPSREVMRVTRDSLTNRVLSRNTIVPALIFDSKSESNFDAFSYVDSFSNNSYEAYTQLIVRKKIEE
jgi:hypothetical protein